MAILQKPPVWFWIVVILLLLWEGLGVYLFVQQLRLGPDAMGRATDYQRALFASLPRWYNYVYAVAIFASFIGALTLVIRDARAATLFVISLIAMLVTFGYFFGATDVIAQQGPGQALGVPIVVVVTTLFAIWFSRTARARGWIG